MNANSLRTGLVINAALLAALAFTAGCAAEMSEDTAPLDSEQLDGVVETLPDGVSADAITARYADNTRLATTANLNLRTGASTSRSIILVMPNGSIVHTADGNAPVNGFYHVTYGAHTGWAYGGYLRTAPASTGGETGGGGGGGSTAVETVIRRARAGVGFSYWWGHGRYLASGATSSNAGSCRGSCPSCSHSGSYGADCSGYVAKVWSIGNDDLSVEAHPYSTGGFVGGTGGGQWSRVTRGSARRGDAFVYNNGSAGHIFLYESGDAWGSMWAYEARGCSTGIVHNLRTATSNYSVIRRAGL